MITNRTDEHPGRMTFAEKERVRAAAFLAPRLYPGAVGIVLRRELLAWDEFGYRFGPASTIAELVEHLMELADHERRRGWADEPGIRHDEPHRQRQGAVPPSAEMRPAAQCFRSLNCSPAR